MRHIDDPLSISAKLVQVYMQLTDPATSKSCRCPAVFVLGLL